MMRIIHLLIYVSLLSLVLAALGSRHRELGRLQEQIRLAQLQVQDLNREIATFPLLERELDMQATAHQSLTWLLQPPGLVRTRFEELLREAGATEVLVEVPPPCWENGWIRGRVLTARCTLASSKLRPLVGALESPFPPCILRFLEAAPLDADGEQLAVTVQALVLERRRPWRRCSWWPDHTVYEPTAVPHAPTDAAWVPPAPPPRPADLPTPFRRP
jgi:hypothetical protein